MSVVKLLNTKFHRTIRKPIARAQRLWLVALTFRSRVVTNYTYTINELPVVK
jgi:hypothetical protein